MNGQGAVVDLYYLDRRRVPLVILPETALDPVDGGLDIGVELFGYREGYRIPAVYVDAKRLVGKTPADLADVVDAYAVSSIAASYNDLPGVEEVLELSGGDDRHLLPVPLPRRNATTGYAGVTPLDTPYHLAQGDVGSCHQFGIDENVYPELLVALLPHVGDTGYSPELPFELVRESVELFSANVATFRGPEPQLQNGKHIGVDVYRANLIDGVG